MRALDEHRTLQIASIILLILFAVTGLTARLEADDYCVAALMSSGNHQNANPVDYTVSMYRGWNGRYTQLLLQSTLARVEPLNNMLMPAVLIALFVLVTRNPLFVAAWLMALPALNETLYWQSAAMTYLLPILIALVAYRWTWRYPVVVVLALIAGGCSESMAVLLVLCGLAIGWLEPERRRAVVAWCIGLAVAFAVVYAAPGNAVRAAYFPTPTLAGLRFGVVEWLIVQMPGTLLSALPGLIAAYCAGRIAPVVMTRGMVRTATGMAVLVTLGMVAMVVFATGNSVLPGRVLALPSLLWCAAAWMYGCWHARKRGSQTLPRRVLMGLLIVALVWYGAQLVDRAQYAAKWDARDGQIRAGEVVSVIDARDTLGVDWVRGCAGSWYGRTLTVMLE